MLNSHMWLGAVVLGFSGHQSHLRGWIKYRLLGPSPRASESVGLGFCISKQFAGKAEAAVW